jgi:hypothetical protein
MKTRNMLAVTLSCLLAPAAWAAGSDDVHDPAVKRAPGYNSYENTQPQQDPKSILDHEKRDTTSDPGTGTDATDAKFQGSGTTSESIPDNIPPARAR